MSSLTGRQLSTQVSSAVAIKQTPEYHYRCAPCNQIFTSQQHWNAHIIDIKNKINALIALQRSCAICDKLCKSVEGLVAHHTVKHPDASCTLSRLHKEVRAKRKATVEVEPPVPVEEHVPEPIVVSTAITSPINENVPVQFVAYDPHLGSLGDLYRHQVKASPVCVSQVCSK
jgi:uncharacterized Zn-finger protein